MTSVIINYKIIGTPDLKRYVIILMVEQILTPQKPRKYGGSPKEGGLLCRNILECQGNTDHLPDKSLLLQV